ncbi:MAG: hypothetical protein M0Q46_01985 [Endomicrobiales bacterium]|nr:hypothetical protein [Endomicrobiales bacterium]
MLAILVGILFIVAGCLGVLVWASDFIVVVRGFMPFMIAIGGIISVVAGISSIKDKLDKSTKK